MTMKRLSLIPGFGLLLMLAFLPGCDEPDPQCTGAKNETIDLFAAQSNPEDILNTLKWSFKDKAWNFYFDFQTANACGKSSLDLYFSFFYTEDVNQDVTLVPYLEVNGERIEPTAYYGVSPFGNQQLLKGGLFKVYSLGTPAIFKIKCGVTLLNYDRSLDEEKAKQYIREYLKSAALKLDYLKL
jgi:hypothetical protein